jgi:hypothetical protein
MADSSGGQVAPAASPTPLRVQSSSKLAFGMTTAALVTLASGGTAVLVAHGTSGVTSATSLPAGALPHDAGSAPASVVVDGVVGGLVPAPAAPRTAEQILREALSLRPEPGPRVLTVPLVALPPVTGLVVDDGTGLPVTLPTAVPTPAPTGAPLLPPVVLPPVDLPGVHLPGLHVGGTVDGQVDGQVDDGPGDPHRQHGRGKAHEKAHEKTHDKAHPKAGGTAAAKGKHARGGRHSR